MTVEIFTVPIHAGGTAQLPINVRLFVAAIAGLGAAAVATTAVDRFDGGNAALTELVAAATGTTSGDVTPPSRTLFVYAIGMILGLVFEGVVVLYEMTGSPAASLAGIVGAAEVSAAAVVAVVTYASTAHAIVPRSRSSESRDTRGEPLRRAWLALSVTFGLALVVMVPVAFLLVPGTH